MVPFAARARAHEGGIVDLSIGSPVDPTPEVIRQHSPTPPTPTPTRRPPERRNCQQAIIAWYERRRGVTGLNREERAADHRVEGKMVALLPFMLGFGEGDTIVHPPRRIPDYSIGAAHGGRRPRSPPTTPPTGPPRRN